MRQFKILVGSIALLSLLVFIFWGITKLQKPDMPKPHLPQPIPTVPEKTQVIAPKATVEKHPVEVVFVAATQTYHFKDVALIETVTSPGQQAHINIDGTLALRLIEGLKSEIPLPMTIPSTIATGKSGKPERIVRGSPGTTIDIDKTLKSLEEHISCHPTERRIDLEIAFKDEIGPGSFSATREKLGFKVLVASHTTLHPTHIDDANRNVNLSLAARKIDGLILAPGEAFGFNKVVGPRTEKNGYLKAGVISRGRVIPGLGGGVCQVSTTLYRAALMADQKILERHNHSIYEGIEYAERGLDSAIAWGYKDLRFQNPLDVPILISCTASPGGVHVEIFSERKPYDDIRIETRNEKTHQFKVETRPNKRLRKGDKKIVQPGVTGYSIESFRLVMRAGKLKEERLSRDRYETYNQIEEVSN